MKYLEDCLPWLCLLVTIIMAGLSLIMLIRQDHVEIMSYIEHGYEQVSIPGSDLRTFHKISRCVQEETE